MLCKAHKNDPNTVNTRLDLRHDLRAVRHPHARGDAEAAARGARRGAG